VRLEDVTQVEPEHVVGAHTDHDVWCRLGDQVALLHESVGIARGHGLIAITALERRQDLQPAMGSVEVPRAATGQVVVECVRLVLLDDPHVLQPAVGDLREGDVDQPVHAAERQRRLRTTIGERRQTTARATSQHDDEHTLTPRTDMATGMVWIGHQATITPPRTRQASTGPGGRLAPHRTHTPKRRGSPQSYRARSA
jgi:hypothetical protein